METVEVKKDVYWVGAIDWGIRDFHGYSTYKGTTYNAYLVLDEKKALFDTVKKGFESDLIHRIRRHCRLEEIDYLIVNHVEPDHSGALLEMVERIKPEKIFCSPMGHKNLLAHYHRQDLPYEVVKSGDSISLGRKTVTFLETRMIHWPDSMFSYIPEDKLLISSDGFGLHWATSERFADELDLNELMHHAAKYFGNILMLYAPLIQKLLNQVSEMGLEIDTIAPDHGLIWRGEDVAKILAAYERWSRHETGAKAVIPFDSMWRSTETMAKTIAEALIGQGISVKLMDLKATHRSDVVTELVDAKAIVCGSATLNNGMMPLMADLLHYLRGLKPLNRLGAAFGSYGWSGEAVKMMNEALETMKVEVVSEGVKIQYRPDHESLKQCTELGLKLAEAIKAGR